MRFYLSYFKLRFISSLQYKAAAIAGISTQIFFGLVFIMVYLAFYESGSSNYPMNVNELVSYLWLNQCLFSLVYMFYKDREIFDLIKSGNIAYELVRPKKLYFMWYCKIIGQRLSKVVLRCIPGLIFAMLLPSPYCISLPYSFSNFIMFIITLIIGTFLMTSLITLFHIITLYSLDEKGIFAFFGVIGDILSGGIVPIPLFPEIMQKITNVLPFRYVSDLSFRVYSNNITISESFTGLIVQIVWLIITILIGNLLLNKALKKVVVQGG